MPTESEQRRVAWIILRAVSEMEMGKSRTASFLRGSHSKSIQEIDEKTGYAGLFW